MRITPAVLLTLVGLTSPVAAQPRAAESDLGDVHFAISCSREAQGAFDHAVALLHHMTYPLAQAEFERVLDLDPACAMGHWGVAATLFQPLWPTRPSADDLRRGWAAVQAARALGAPTERERLFVASMAAFYRGPAEQDYWTRVRRWETAMAELYETAGRDAEVAAFYALAHLAVAPPGGSSLANQDRVAAILLALHADRPRHPGAVHYLIHANDVRGREHESLDIVRSYGEIAPRNPHALHMPSHIFTRIGSWEEVVTWNERAAAAALEHPAGPDGEYVWDEFPHAVEYLVFAHLQRGDDHAAAAERDRLLGMASLQPSFKTAFHVASIPARYALERHAWEEAAALVPRPEIGGLDWDRFPWPEAVTWHAVGIGAAHQGDAATVRRALDRLGALEETADDTGEALFTLQIRVLRTAVSAWLASLDGEPERAERLMRAAAELEVEIPKPPVTPGPVVTGFELLGALLLAHGEPGEALVAFRRSLDLYPNRFNSVLGVARSAAAAGEAPAAREAYARLVSLGVEGSARSSLAEARSYLGDEDR